MSEPAETFNNFLSFIEWMRWLNSIDDVDQAKINIDLVHHKIHEGKFFSISIIDTDVDTEAPKYLRITAPNTSTRIHFTGQVYVTAASLIEFFEDPTISTAGDALTEYNNNRNSDNPSTATTFEDTTVSNDGTRIDSGRAGGAARPNFRIGGETARRNEWILKQGEDYVLKITPDADNTEVVVSLTWYEV
ncbi:MAG: hypothetical protein KKD44_26090 [Proteobacteria bacterium]|nr:hypothetical protein [Pseudomonadota bacterium]